jgi:hypothetical protein
MHNGMRRTGRRAVRWSMVGHYRSMSGVWPPRQLMARSVLTGAAYRCLGIVGGQMRTCALQVHTVSNGPEYGARSGHGRDSRHAVAAAKRDGRAVVVVVTAVHVAQERRWRYWRWASKRMPKCPSTQTPGGGLGCVDFAAEHTVTSVAIHASGARGRRAVPQGLRVIQSPGGITGPVIWNSKRPFLGGIIGVFSFGVERPSGRPSLSWRTQSTWCSVTWAELAR